MNDPHRQIEILQNALSSDKSKIAFLLGAGCPVSIPVKDGDNTRPLIPDIKELTNTICETLKDKHIDKIISRIHLPESKTATVEDILGHVRLLAEVVGDSNIDNFTKENLEDLDNSICQALTTAVDK